ncbi:MAG: hypothetical protein Q8Q73_19380 [Stagnimonas sp.]|nr:hypothetical protein [Stagnimonas sp.]
MYPQRNRLLALLVRDSLLIALTLALWSWTLELGRPQGAGPIAIHLATALMTVLCGYLVHEWGHLCGALLARGQVVLPRPFESPFLFRFDLHRNSRRQFAWMASGGFVSSLLLVLLLVTVLPYALLASQVALGLVALGVLATFVIEVPEFWGVVVKGGPLPTGAAFVTTANGKVEAAAPR